MSQLSSPGTEREGRIRWRHALPRGRPVVRHDAIVELARGRRVIHVGFVDELAATKLAQGVWLHSRLAPTFTPPAAGLQGCERVEQQP